MAKKQSKPTVVWSHLDDISTLRTKVSDLTWASRSILKTMAANLAVDDIPHFVALEACLEKSDSVLDELAALLRSAAAGGAIHG